MWMFFQRSERVKPADTFREKSEFLCNRLYLFMSCRSSLTPQVYTICPKNMSARCLCTVSKLVQQHAIIYQTALCFQLVAAVLEKMHKTRSVSESFQSLVLKNLPAQGRPKTTSQAFSMQPPVAECEQISAAEVTKWCGGSNINASISVST